MWLVDCALFFALLAATVYWTFEEFTVAFEKCFVLHLTSDSEKPPWPPFYREVHMSWMEKLVCDRYFNHSS